MKGGIPEGLVSEYPIIFLEGRSPHPSGRHTTKHTNNYGLLWKPMNKWGKTENSGEFDGIYHLVNVNVTNWKDPPLLFIGKLNVFMDMFHSYVTNCRKVINQQGLLG